MILREGRESLHERGPRRVIRNLANEHDSCSYAGVVPTTCYSSYHIGLVRHACPPLSAIIQVRPTAHTETADQSAHPSLHAMTRITDHMRSRDAHICLKRV